VAAVGNNGVDGAGVAYNATILPIKITLGSDTSGTSTDVAIAQAITYAADHGAKVVNVSFGSDTSCDSQTMINAANYMISKGGLVVQAAGNTPINKGCSANPSIIEVSATDQNDALATFSNFGNEVAVSAPGVGIVTTNCNTCSLGPGLGDMAVYDGTSFASPVTAGVVAMIYSIDPNFTSAQAQQILFGSVDDLGPAGYDIDFGWGRVNAAKAVTLAQQTLAGIPPPPPALGPVYAFPNPWDTRKESQRQVTFVNIPTGATLKIFTLSGFWVKSLMESSNRCIWDLTNDDGRLIASGLYLYSVSGGNTGSTMTGKIAVIR
ncbi:MAG TPA: S8 family serine peptidase, partial [Elusimicrobiota bacterium]|nr:S8 family serine peptidase [Elusimicrobiota bacterium]